MEFSKNQSGNKHKTSGRAKKAYKPDPPYASVEGIHSLAWEKLKPHDVFTLLELYRKFDGYNRNRLFLSYREVSPKMANGTFTKSTWKLMGFGLIDIRRFGRLEKNNSIYALSDRWKSLSENPKKLDKIEKLLIHLDKTKRIPTPKNLTEKQKSRFRFKRRMLIREIQNKILNAGKSG